MGIETIGVFILTSLISVSLISFVFFGLRARNRKKHPTKEDVKETNRQRREREKLKRETKQKVNSYMKPKTFPTESAAENIRRKTKRNEPIFYYCKESSAYGAHRGRTGACFCEKKRNALSQRARKYAHESCRQPCTDFLGKFCSSAGGSLLLYRNRFSGSCGGDNRMGSLL